MTALLTACTLLALQHHADVITAREVCTIAYVVEPVTGIDAEVVAAVAWEESRFQVGVVSPRGAVGVMQVLPHLTDEGMGDVVSQMRAGVEVMLYWRGREPSRWLACYNAGNSCSGRRYAGRVRKSARLLRRWRRKMEESR